LNGENSFYFDQFFLGTASYRLMPEIILKEPIYDQDAEQLQKCFTQGVIELEDDNNGKQI
jgi:DNA-directed RNA polymerase I and III subunit RPAC1